MLFVLCRLVGFDIGIRPRMTARVTRANKAPIRPVKPDESATFQTILSPDQYR